MKIEGMGAIVDFTHPDELRKVREMLLPAVEEALTVEPVPPFFASLADGADSKKVAPIVTRNS